MANDIGKREEEIGPLSSSRAGRTAAAETSLQRPSGHGEMATRVREHAWASTPLGPIEHWPQSLRAAVDLILASPLGMAVLWGPELVQIYNDAYRAILLDKHPAGLGQPAQECRPEISAFSGPIYEAVWGGEARSFTDQPMTIFRCGVPEQAYFDLNYSPLRDEPDAALAGGRIAGVLVTAVDVTSRVQAELRLRESEERQAFLLAISDALRPLTDPIGLQQAAMKLLAEHLDVMRASYFEIDGDQDGFTLTARYERNPAPIPERMRLSDFAPDMAAAYRTGRTLIFRDTESEAQLEPQRAAYRAIDVRAWAAVPLVKTGRLLAVVGVHSTTPRDWTLAEIQVLEDVAERTWAAVERARAEAALQRSEERFRNIATLVPALLWQTDPDGETVTFNAGWLSYTGQANQAVRGSVWLSAVHPDDAPNTAQAFARAIGTGNPLELQHRIRRADGSYRWFLVRQIPLRESGDRITGWIGAATDIDETRRALEAFKESERVKSILTDELQHRVNSLLAMVRAIAFQSVTNAENLEDFHFGFEDRLEALARAQQLLVTLNIEESSLSQVIEAEMLAHGGRLGENVTADGPDVRLRPKAVQILALGFHELFTNAVKFGALSSAAKKGRIEIQWAVEPAMPAPRLLIRWQESGLSAVDWKPERRGQGRDLIEEGLVHELRAETRLEFRPGGIRCNLDIPLRPQTGYVVARSMSERSRDES